MGDRCDAVLRLWADLSDRWRGASDMSPPPTKGWRRHDQRSNPCMQECCRLVRPCDVVLHLCSEFLDHRYRLPLKVIAFAIGIVSTSLMRRIPTLILVLLL